MLELWGSPSSNHPHHIRLRHQLLVVLAPRGSPVLGRQQPPRLGQDHPREAPPVIHPAAVHVILEVVAMAGSKIGCALPGQAIEPSVVPRRQVVVSKVVQGVAPYRPAYRVELAFEHLVVPATVVELMESAGVLADAG